jgi:cytochrome oxidase Cu insertion factor (SCO1/SenC/PrrC family)
MDQKPSNDEQSGQSINESTPIAQDSVTPPIQSPTELAPTNKSKRKLVTWWLIVSVIVLLLAVAGVVYFFNNKNQDTKTASDNAQTSAVLGQKEVDEAVKSVEKWSKAYFSGDSSGACDLVTDNYVKDTAAQDNIPDDCKGQVDGGSALAKAFGIEESEFTYSGRLEEGMIIVSAKWSGSEGADNYQMVNEGGTWKINAKIITVSEEEKEQEAQNAIVDEWNALSQEERDSWYNTDGTGGFDAYAKSKEEE